ncbi:hypothetical protein [Nakamurella multipartita]|jgi:hypothetical protein|nr:hypothetical protein [Nakamurella multipartita]HOZ57589.1 hypothetical protein [Nakamurella multipartita]
MTAALIVLALFLLLAVAGPRFGTDSRRPRGWAERDPDTALWSDPGVAHLR